jgi:hypothetical protein
MQPNQRNLERKLVEVVDFYRGFILDIAEQELGSNNNWQFTRGRLLKALGDRGLTGKIREVLSTELANVGGSHE